MYKSILITTKIACLFFFAVFIFGCDNQTEPPQAPKVITQKIAVGTPTQIAPQKPPTQPPPAPQQQPGPAQKTPPSAKPETLSKTIQPVPVAEKPLSVPGKTIAAAQPVPASVPKKAEQTAAVYEETAKKGVPPPPPQDQKADKAADKSEPDTIAGAPKSAETSGQDVDAPAAETDLEKLAADAVGSYSPAGKVDPFLPLFEEKPVVPEDAGDAEKQKKKRRMPLTPLERVDLSQLKLVGIIQAPSGNKALVEEASGKGYIIKKGAFIGIHAGRVLEIQKDQVVVEEEVENVLGQFTLEKKELKLQKPPGEF
ncbi:MAG: pilus assembly protein PilP [Desulfobacterales bacterium]|nr:pilus assembly protein PilP [Desulfobacterales bacterium]